MAQISGEKTPEDNQGNSPVANKKLLLTGIVLAVIVVVLYNVQVARIRATSRGKTVELLRLARDMQPGQKIRSKDLEAVEVPQQFLEGLDNYIKAENIDYAITSTLQQPVIKGRWLMYEHTVNPEKSNPSARISPNMVTYTLTIDPRRSPGEILRVGDRVSILGMLQVNNKPLQAYRIIEDLKVIEIGGMSFRDTPLTVSKRSSKQAMRQFAKITVEVNKDISLQLANILSHLSGSAWLEVRNPTAGSRFKTPKVDPELRNLAGIPTTIKTGR